MTWMATLSWLASGSNLAPANPLHLALRTPTVPRGEPSCFPWPEESSPSGLAPSPASLLPMYTPAPGTLGHLQYLTTSLASPLVHSTTATPYPILATSSLPSGLSWHVASPACHCPVCSGWVHAPLRVLSPLRPPPSDVYSLHFLCLPITSLLSWPENQWRSWHVISIQQTHAKQMKE